jgi:hypothetical protein
MTRLKASIENPLSQVVTNDPILLEPWALRQRGPQEWVTTFANQGWTDWHAPKVMPPVPSSVSPVEPSVEPPKENPELEQRVAKLEEELALLRAELAARPIVRSYQLYDLGLDELELTAPIVIVLEEYQGRYVARLPEFEAVGIGEFEGEAITRLKRDIVTIYWDLEREPLENLDEITLRWRKVLQGLIRKVQ